MFYHLEVANKLIMNNLNGFSRTSFPTSAVWSYTEPWNVASIVLSHC